MRERKKRKIKFEKKKKISKEKRYIGWNSGDQTQTSGSPFSGESHNQCITLPATISDNTYMVLPNKEAQALQFRISAGGQSWKHGMPV